jgi:hypothetical protein
MTSPDGEMTLRAFAPRPALRAPVNAPTRPRFEVIDAHNHLGDVFSPTASSWLRRPVSDLLAIMDDAGVRAMVDLDGRWGDRLRAEIARYQEPYHDRFAGFAGVD